MVTYLLILPYVYCKANIGIVLVRLHKYNMVQTVKSYENKRQTQAGPQYEWNILTIYEVVTKLRNIHKLYSLWLTEGTGNSFVPIFAILFFLYKLMFWELLWLLCHHPIETFIKLSTDLCTDFFYFDIMTFIKALHVEFMKSLKCQQSPQIKSVCLRLFFLKQFFNKNEKKYNPRHGWRKNKVWSSSFLFKLWNLEQVRPNRWACIYDINTRKHLMKWNYSKIYKSLSGKTW